MSNYFKYNPVAKNLFKSNFSNSLFENESVNLTIRSILDACMGIYQRIFWDMAPSRERTVKGAGEKLKPIMNAKTMKDLSAILITDAEDSDLISSDYSSCKVLYLEALSKYCEALETACDINSSNEDYIVETAKKMAQRLMDQINLAAKQLAVEKEQSTNESQYFYINEGLFTGYRGRVEDLKKILTNLIVQSKDKDQKNGYGRDWNTTFIELDEKRKLLDISRGGFGEKDKKALEDLEKQVEKFRLEFLKVSQNVIDRNLQKVADDEELAGSYGDMETLCSAAKDAKTRADVQYSQIILNKKEEHKEEEETFVKTIFPIVRGDNDSNERFKDSGLIFAIQKTLIDGIPSASNLLKRKGAPNGKFGPATEAVIRTLQKISGNKNINGQIDSSLLSDIISSDWVSEENRKAVQKALELTKTKLQESASVISFDDYFNGVINEGKIIIKDDEFSAELDNQYKETSGETFVKSQIVEKPEGEENEDSSESKIVDKLVKNLVNFNVKATRDSFLRENGSFRQGYDFNFIKSWNDSIEKISDDFSNYLAFYYDGGIYSIKRASSSLRYPLNWSKFEKVDKEDDPIDFIRNYSGVFSGFGGFSQSIKSEKIDRLIERFKLSRDEDFFSNTSNGYKIIEKINSGELKNVPYIKKNNLDSICKYVSNMFDVDGSDLSNSQYILLSNIVVTLSNLVYYSDDSGKFDSALKFFVRGYLKENRLNDLANDGIYTSLALPAKFTHLYLGDNSVAISFLSDSLKNANSIKVGSFNEEIFPGVQGFYAKAKKSNKSVKMMLGANLARACNVVYPSIKNHVERINAKSFDAVPQQGKSKCINSGN
jgi:hypothetical protein